MEATEDVREEPTLKELREHINKEQDFSRLLELVNRAQKLINDQAATESA